MKNFLANARYRLSSFMSGRYGTDKLYTAISCACLVLIVASMVVTNRFASSILFFAVLALLVINTARCLSRNYTARAKENSVYLRLTAGIRQWFSLLGRRWRDRKTHRYVKCKHCKSMMRLPYKKGTHTALCPKCGQTFKVKL